MSLFKVLHSQCSNPIIIKNLFWMLKCSKRIFSSLYRFFCPPPCVYLSGPGWKLKQEQINGKSWAASLDLSSKAAFHLCQWECDPVYLCHHQTLLSPLRLSPPGPRCLHRGWRVLLPISPARDLGEAGFRVCGYMGLDSMGSSLMETQKLSFEEQPDAKVKLIAPYAGKLAHAGIGLRYPHPGMSHLSLPWDVMVLPAPPFCYVTPYWHMWQLSSQAGFSKPRLSLAPSFQVDSPVTSKLHHSAPVPSPSEQHC